MYQNSLERMAAIKSKVETAIKDSIFPVETNDRILDIESIDKLTASQMYDQSFNIKNHLDAKLKSKDLVSPIKATLVLRDKNTGDIIDRRKVSLIDQPVMTNRGSFIYGGNDYHVVNQLRLKPGVYTRVKDNGEVESFFNLSKGGSSGMSMWMNPESGKINFKIGGKNPSLYSIMKALGVSDKEIESKWGKDLFELNKLNEVQLEKDISKVYHSLYKSKADAGLDLDGMKREIKAFFDNTELAPETTKITLGREFDKITADALLRTSDKLIKVSKNEEEPDERDSLVFKNIMPVEELLGARINAKSREVKAKIKNNLNTKDTISDIYSKEYLNKPIRSFLTQSSLSTTSDQTNPVSMVNALTRTTLMGEGGISSLDIVTTGMRAVSNSHLGALDPSQTPESKRIGINLNLTKDALIEDKEIKTPVLNLKTGKTEYLSNLDRYEKYVAFPDQYDSKTKKFNFDTARVLYKGKIEQVPHSKVDYAIEDPSSMLSVASNIIPFFADVQGNRAMMANKMSGQAISLKNREAPLVQVKNLRGDVDYDGTKLDTEEKALARVFSVKSPVDGQVLSVRDDYAEIKSDADGEIFKVYRYDYFPLANKAFMHSDFIIKPGDKVKYGQTIAEDNFTKDKTLALGTNLNIAYLPFKDKTFEDGIVISESAAKKLTSQHLYTYKTSYGDDDKLGVSTYMQQFPSSMTSAQQAKLDANGVIKQGEIVEPGDTLVALLHYREPSESDIALGRLSKTLITKYIDGGVKYDHDTVGKVVRVTHSNGEIGVYVSTETPAVDGDKLVGRYGNKGVITGILPDEEMPVSETGIRSDLLMAPYGVPGRINVGQIYEPIAGKAALKKGSPIKITNFDTNIKSNKAIEALANEYGVKPSEKMYDPKTGRLLAETTVGPAYIYKLTHTVEKKQASRGPYAAYNSDEQPAKTGSTSARAMDRLTWNAMIAHGARENLREAATYKANKNSELWNKIRLGLPLPAPQTPFATDKLFSLMQAAGINVKKDGQQLMLIPMTDSEILSKSNGAIDDAQVMMAKTLRPIKDGLFDDIKTGGIDGKKWTHIELAEPVVSPIMSQAAMTVLDMTGKKFDRITSGNLYINPQSMEESESAAPGFLTGGEAIKTLLSKVDPAKALSDLKSQVKGLSGDKLDKVNKKMRYLRALDENKLKPDEAYIIKNIPVMPPHMRPIYSLPDGSLSTSPINFLYRDLIMINKELKAAQNLPEFARKKLREDLYLATKAVQGLGDPVITRGEKKVVGALETIKGDQPKEGYFQSVVFSKNQELSGQSTVAPSADVSPDEVLMPKAMAWNMFEPFIHNELIKMGYSNIQAKQLVAARDPKAEIAMERVAENKLVWVNRAPSLHKLSILAMRPKLYNGSAVKVNPLVVGGYNMDFDGDTVGLYVPVSPAAVEEAKRFMPSKILDDPRDYSVTLKPTLDIQLGLFTLSNKGQKKLDKKYASLKEAEADFIKNNINLNDVVQIGGYETTLGREKLKSVIPEGIPIPDNGIDKSYLDKFLRDVATKDPANVNRRFADITKLSTENNLYSGVGLTLKDLATQTEIMAPFKKRLKEQVSQAKSSAERVDAISSVIKDFNSVGKVWTKDNVWKNNLATMLAAAGKPGMDSVRQLIFSPMAVTDEEGKTIPIPIIRNYSEGVTASDYWISSSGARKGMIDRALQTAEPGYFAKQMISVAVDQVVSMPDCGTKNGIELDLLRDKRDILWRYNLKGELIDNAAYENLLRTGQTKVKVRSPITCEAADGVCQKCYGSKPNGNPVEIGANVGTEAGQVATERTTQLTMKTFHTGSVATSGPSLASGFERVQQLSHFPDFIKDRATLAKVDGTVTDIKPNPAGGLNIYIGDEKHFCPVSHTSLKVGDKVTKGQALTEGVIKPQELLATKGIRAAQDYLIDEMQKAFQDQGVGLNRRSFETVMRATTNVTKITDPGESEFLPGDKVQLTKVLAYNKLHPEAPIKHEPELLGLDFSSKVTDDWLAKLNTNRIQSVLQDAVASGGKSYTHSYNPVAPYVIGSEFGKGDSGKY